jgi:hypothetical protein
MDMNLLHRVIYSPGVRQVGIPTAVAITLFRAFQAHGVTWSILATRSFWLGLAETLLISGILGGLFFEWFVAKLGYPMAPASSDEHHDHPA